MITLLAGSLVLQKQIGEQARQRCRKQFSVERMVEATRELYGDVLASSSGRPS